MQIFFSIILINERIKFGQELTTSKENFGSLYWIAKHFTVLIIAYDETRKVKIRINICILQHIKYTLHCFDNQTFSISFSISIFNFIFVFNFRFHFSTGLIKIVMQI